MKKKVGILFKNNENWIGGTYYILNLIHSFNLLPVEKKPEIFLLFEKQEDFDLVKQETGYLFLNPVNYSDLKNKGYLKFFKRRSIRKIIAGLDVVFPYPFNDYELPAATARKIYWIGDFQEKHLPHFFSEKAIQNRHQLNSRIAVSGAEVVFSSNSARNDFDTFYPENNCVKHLLQFAVTHPESGKLNKKEILKKYNLEEPYFISPNQFWAHKNHNLIIDAVKSLKDRGVDIVICFTGKEHDYRYPEYTNELKSKVHELGLEKAVRFLGFIDRKDQLFLMKHAKAVIQASLFEGWSTVVEDAKALGAHLILSDLPVHREQNPNSVSWFQKDSVDSLIDAILHPGPPKPAIDYYQNRLNYASQFQKILDFRRPGI
jgi:glycosyltransferase involved in cell wall biosynthesis